MFLQPKLEVFSNLGHFGFACGRIFHLIVFDEAADVEMDGLCSQPAIIFLEHGVFVLNPFLRAGSEKLEDAVDHLSSGGEIFFLDVLLQCGIDQLTFFLYDKNSFYRVFRYAGQAGGSRIDESWL